MKRLLRGSVVLAVAVGFLSCSGDPTDSFRQPSGIVATPTTVFINVGETKPVLVSLQDDQGNQIAADYEVTAVGPGIAVVQDTTYLHTTAPGVSIDNQARFQVTASAIANSSFTLTAGGESLVVPVRVTPATVDLGISNPTPQWGDTLVLTAPAGVLFTAESEVGFSGAAPGDVVGVSADRTQITVVPGPNANGPVTVTHTTVAYDENLDFTITSSGTVVSPPLTELVVTLSTATPALGQAVTLTLPTGVRVLPDSFVLPDSTPGVLGDSGLIVEGAANPLNVTVSTDSSQITFIPQPNSDSIFVISGVVPSRLPQFPQVLATTTKITTPAIDSMPATFSDQGPDIGEVITLTAGAGFSFSQTATIAWGTSAAIITSVSADSSQVSVMPPPDAVGRPTVNGVRVAAAPIFFLSRPATDSLDVTAVSVFTGKESPATAPALTIPPVGTDTTEFFDATIVDQFYRLNITAANTILAIRADWPTGADVDLLVCNNTCTLGAHFPFGFAGATAAHPENHIVTFVTPGTYYVYINLFAGATPYHRVRLIRTQ